MLFRSEEHLAVWGEQKGLPKGEAVPLSQLMALAEAWYHNRLDVNYRGRSLESAHQVFESVGLTGAFWRKG